MKCQPLAIGALVCIVSPIWWLQVERSAWCNDESAHIPAGLYHLETGRMDAYRVNPPLPRMLSAIPLVFDRPKIDWHYSKSPFVRSEYQFAHQWIPDNASDLKRYLILARCSTLLFFIVGVVVIAQWTRRLYGPTAAWVATLLWSLNPDIITHSAVAAPDLAASASGLLAGYLYWDWLGRKHRPFPWNLAASVAFAVLCKFSWIFLFPALPLFTVLYDSTRKPLDDEVDIQEAHDPNVVLPWRGTLFKSLNFKIADSLRLLFSYSFSVLLINWCYGFDGTGTELGDFEFISQSLGGNNQGMGLTGNRFADSIWGRIPMPLPAEMLRGIDYLKWEFENGMECYLNGVWQHRGWWYFYLYAIAVKMPIGYLVLICLGVASFVLDGVRNSIKDKLECLPLLIAVAFVALISSQTGFTHHVRYVLPAYGFLFIVAARFVRSRPRWFAVSMVSVCVAGTLCFHATHLGLSHTFFNPIAGGPDQGWRHLSYSNVDWGQSTYRMVDWVKKHPEQRPMTVLFVSSLGGPEHLITDQADVATSVRWKASADHQGQSVIPPGYYLLSSHQMTLQQNQPFKNLVPIERPCPDMLLFRVLADSL